jgi:hypothetical protein
VIGGAAFLGLVALIAWMLGPRSLDGRQLRAATIRTALAGCIGLAVISILRLAIHACFT